jgi:hypothetical protein
MILAPVLRVAVATSPTPPTAPPVPSVRAHRLRAAAAAHALAPELVARGPAFVAELVHAMLSELAAATPGSDVALDLAAVELSDRIETFTRRCARRQRRACERAARRGRP